MTAPTDDAAPLRLRWTRPLTFFRPILAGATLRDRMVACLGALIGIGLTGLLCRSLAGTGGSFLPVLVAPMGASAVLLFAVPASPLAQPWSVVGGNVVSAVVGIAVARIVPDPMLAAAIAVALAIATMSLLRCLHPPGGAVALTVALGDPVIASAGFLFALAPVGLNSAAMVAAGWAFHRFSGHSYPHVAPAPAVSPHGTIDPPPKDRVGFTATDVDAALDAFGEPLDVSRDDLDTLFRQVETRAAARQRGDIRCRDIMSRDLVTIEASATPDAARALLLAHSLRTLPVLDGDGRVVGSVGHQELAMPSGHVLEVMTSVETATPDTPAFRLVDRLAGGRVHEVMIVDSERRLLGLVTQTDLLATLSRRP